MQDRAVIRRTTAWIETSRAIAMLRMLVVRAKACVAVKLLSRLVDRLKSRHGRARARNDEIRGEVGWGIGQVGLVMFR